jgi:hypothetical protein
MARGVPENPLRPVGVVRRLVAGYAHVPSAQQIDHGVNRWDAAMAQLG